MAVETIGQFTEDVVPGIGGRAVHDQLVARDTEYRDRDLAQEDFGPAHEAFGRGLEVGMPGRIHRSLLERDRQLDQKVGGLPAQGGLSGSLRLPPLQGGGGGCGRRRIRKGGMGHVASTDVPVLSDGDPSLSAKGAPSGSTP